MKRLAKAIPLILILLSSPVLAQSLIDQILAGRTEMVRQSLDKDPALARQADPRGSTPLHTAAAAGQHAIVELLIQKGARVDAPDVEGATPLVLAIRNRKAAVVQILVREGANARITYGEDGRTLLHEAVLSGSRGMVSLALDNGANLEGSARDKGTALHLACDGGDTLMVTILLQKGALLDARGPLGESPLHRAAGHGHLSLVRYMTYEGANPKARDREGLTPADWAAKNGHAQVAEFLR